MKVVLVIFEILVVIFAVKCNCSEDYYDASDEFDSDESTVIIQTTEKAVDEQTNENLDTDFPKETKKFKLENVKPMTERKKVIIQPVIAKKNVVKSSEDLDLQDSNSNEKDNGANFKAEKEKVATDNRRVAKTKTKTKTAAKVHYLIKKPNRTRGLQQDENKEDVERKVDDGEDVHNNQSTYPYSVSIQKRGSHYATGALLNTRWIISSAAEFFNVRESIKLFRARLGTANCKKGGLLVPLKGVEIHPMYKHGKPLFDLSLIRTGQMVNYTDFIRPIVLSKVTAKILSAKFLTTYWPRLIVKGEILPASANEREKQSSMRVSIQRLIPWEKCSKTLEPMGVKLNTAGFCLKPVISHHSRCMPDAGAPVVAGDGLWGITSGWTSDQCYAAPSPTMFTRIAAPRVISWIESHIH